MFPSWKYEFLILIIGLSTSGVIAFGTGNVPRFEVACDEFALYVIIAFKNPFNGVVYSKGYHSDYRCRNTVPENSTTLQAALRLHSGICGNEVKEGNGTSSISNTIIVQEHPLLQTLQDFSQYVSCKVRAREQFSQPTIFDKAFAPDIRHLLKDVIPTVKIWADIRLGIDGQSVENVTLGSKLMLVINVQDGGTHSDMKVRNCVAHDKFLAREASKVARLTNECGFPEPLEILGEFKVTNETGNSSGLMAYSELKAFKFPSQGNLFITCGVQVCKNTCDGFCEKKLKKNVSRKILVKRSILYKRHAATMKALENRNRFMRATIRALSNSLKKRLRQNEENSLEKRYIQSNDDSFVLGNEILDVTTLTSFQNNEIHDNLETTSDYIDYQDEENTDWESTEHSTDFVTKVDSATETPTATLHVSSFREARLNEIININVTKSFTVIYPDEGGSDVHGFGNIAEMSTSDCVPKIRFSLVTGMLSCILLCLVITCFALVMHMRREKKKHLIDTFLLYNFN